MLTFFVLLFVIPILVHTQQYNNANAEIKELYL